MKKLNCSIWQDVKLPNLTERRVGNDDLPVDTFDVLEQKMFFTGIFIQKSLSLYTMSNELGVYTAPSAKSD